jgi:hypothetical protein
MREFEASLCLALEIADASGSVATFSGRNFSATVRSSSSSRARHTTPMPPRPAKASSE